MQDDLDSWLDDYNTNRSIRGGGASARRPCRLFLDSKNIAKKKTLMATLQSHQSDIDPHIDCEIKYQLLQLLKPIEAASRVHDSEGRFAMPSYLASFSSPTPVRVIPCPLVMSSSRLPDRHRKTWRLGIARNLCEIC